MYIILDVIILPNWVYYGILDVDVYGYGSIPINTIFRGMNIHKSQLFWCSPGVQGFDTLPYHIGCELPNWVLHWSAMNVYERIIRLVVFHGFDWCFVSPSSVKVPVKTRSFWISSHCTAEVSNHGGLPTFEPGGPPEDQSAARWSQAFAGCSPLQHAMAMPCYAMGTAILIWKVYWYLKECFPEKRWKERHIWDL